MSKEQMAAALEKCGLSATVRGEALTLAQFAELANVLSEDTGKINVKYKNPSYFKNPIHKVALGADSQQSINGMNWRKYGGL